MKQLILPRIFASLLVLSAALAAAVEVEVSADGGTASVSTPLGLIYGTAWKKDATASLVDLAIRAGFRRIDTACQPKHYNEAAVGEGLQSALSDL